MGNETIEVICARDECGDPVSSGGINPVIMRKRRKMNHMSTLDATGFGTFVLTNLIGIAKGANRGVSPAKYHIYQCPVCSAQKVYREDSSGNVRLVGSTESE